MQVESVDFGGDDADEAEADDDAEASAPPRGRIMDHLFRIPKNDGSGAWVFSREAAVEDISKVLQMRHEALSGSHCDILSHELLKKLVRQHFDDWVKDPQNADTVLKIQDLHKGVKSKIIRDLSSRHRTYCFERYGGREWMHLLFCFGRFDDKILEAVNKAGRERLQRLKEERAAQWNSEEKLLEIWQANASSRGRVFGIQHRKSQAKHLREQARKAEKQLDKASLVGLLSMDPEAKPESSAHSKRWPNMI